MRMSIIWLSQLSIVHAIDFLWFWATVTLMRGDLPAVINMHMLQKLQSGSQLCGIYQNILIVFSDMLLNTWKFSLVV